MVNNIQDIKLPRLELPDGSLFNLYDNEKEDDRLMILGSRRGLKVVSRAKVLLTDGTFKSAPSTVRESWYQVFVIHAEYMDTGEIFPCINLKSINLDNQINLSRRKSRLFRIIQQRKIYITENLYELIYMGWIYTTWVGTLFRFSNFHSKLSTCLKI